MSVKHFLHQSWILRLQGDYVLPVARVAYLTIAGISLLAALLGLLVAAYFQINASQSTSARAVPDVPQAPAVSINLDALSNSFLPPTHIRAVALSFTRPVTADTALIFLDADSPHGLAPYPDDFYILGGADASLLIRAPINSGGRLHTGFKPASTLIDELNGVHPARQFSIRVAAKDASGGVSQPANITFTLVPIAEPATPAPKGPPPATALETLAREIALFVDPNRSPIYFDAYQRALQEPGNCGTSPSDSNFVSEYQRAFAYMRPKLNKDALDNFYKELCTAWGTGIQAQRMSIEQAMAQHDQAVAESLADQFRAQAEAVTSGLARNAALVFVAGAMGLFLCLSLFLAFLAIENHSKAMRETLAALAAKKEQS